MKKLIYTLPIMILVISGCDLKGFVVSNPLVNSTTTPPNRESTGIACTTEAKLCPNGSAVGRAQPNCEFASCPIEEGNIEKQTTRRLGETCGENIGNCVAGLKCAYPCGIQGCENVCLPENELPRP